MSQTGSLKYLVGLRDFYPTAEEVDFGGSAIDFLNPISDSIVSPRLLGEVKFPKRLPSGR